MQDPRRIYSFDIHTHIIIIIILHTYIHTHTHLYTHTYIGLHTYRQTYSVHRPTLHTLFNENYKRPHQNLQELSYRQQIARQLRTQYADGIYRHKYYTVTLTSRLRVTRGHWKRNHWIDHTRLGSSRVIWRLILLWPWNVVTEGHWKWYHLKAWVRFPIRLP